MLTAWIVGKTDRFRAAVVAKPVINWSSFVLTSDITSFFYKYWFGAYPWEQPEQYWKRSPLSLVGNVKTPTMLLTGEADYRTPIARVGAVLPGAEAAQGGHADGAHSRGLAWHDGAAQQSHRQGGQHPGLVREDTGRK